MTVALAWAGPDGLSPVTTLDESSPDARLGTHVGHRFVATPDDGAAAAPPTEFVVGAGAGRRTSRCGTAIVSCNSARYACRRRKKRKGDRGRAGEDREMMLTSRRRTERPRAAATVTPRAAAASVDGSSLWSRSPTPSPPNGT